MGFRKPFFVMILMLAPGVLLAAAEPGASPRGDTRPELLKGMKRLEKALGFRRTRNFRKFSEKPAAAYRCYYTGKLELPESYEGLQLQAGTKNGCAVDAEEYDVFFYPLEAVPFRKTPVTASLARESTERFLVVVPHEDFHESRELQKLPAVLNEAASTLIGFLTGGELAREQFGEDSDVSRNLAREPELFLRKAAIVNRYYDRLRALYATARSGEISPSEALQRKQRVFQEMQQECQALRPDPKSFNKCPAAANNAGLAFDRTYTKYYPLMYELYLANGGDLKQTTGALKQALSTRSEVEAVERLEGLTRQRATLNLEP